MDQVFSPNKLISLVETRQIFVKLAHSSVMRLNESSMSKLFDLMLMGVKFQSVQTCYPEEIYHVTMRHLNTMAMLVKNSQTLGNPN